MKLILKKILVSIILFCLVYLFYSKHEDAHNILFKKFKNYKKVNNL